MMGEIQALKNSSTPTRIKFRRKFAREELEKEMSVFKTPNLSKKAIKHRAISIAVKRPSPEERDHSSEEEEKDIDVTVIEQKFTNVNRSLYIVKVENLKMMLNANPVRDDFSNKEGNITPRPLSINNEAFKLGSSQVKQELKNFQFEIGADQRFTCKIF